MSNQAQPLNVLRIDASMRRDGSVTRDLADALVAVLADAPSGAAVTNRDLADGLPLIDEAWIGANFTDPGDRSDAQREHLALSNELVGELKAADAVVLAVPVYNFGVPAAMKAWVDLIARARETFRYSENGPIGLLEGKKAYLVIASGGTELGSDIDFASGYLKHILGFVGITDVTLIAADRLAVSPEESLASARAAIAELAADPEALAA